MPLLGVLQATLKVLKKKNLKREVSGALQYDAKC
jgi:hypothetical protein